MTAFLRHQMAYPFDSEEYRSGEGVMQLPPLPSLSVTNQNALRVWNVKESLGVSLNEALNILGLELTRCELYYMAEKLIQIKTEIERKKNESPKKLSGPYVASTEEE